MRRSKNRTVRLEEVVIDQRAQTRADGLDEAHVAQMVDDLKDLPPMLVVDVNGRLLLADGFHRHAAYRRAKMLRVPVAVISGTEDDWVDAFASANEGQKGKPRTREDKRNAVRRCLELRPGWSNRRVADSAKVSEGLVRELRKYAVDHTPDEQPQPRTYEVDEPAKREGKDGKMRPATMPKAQKTQAEQATPPAVASEDEQPTPVIVSPPPPPAAEPVNQQPDQPDDDTEQTATIDAGAVFVDEVGDVCRQLDRVAGRLKELRANPLAFHIHFDSATQQVEAARKTVWQGRPAHECPYCKAEGEVRPDCKACRGLNRVKKTTYDAGIEAVGGGK